MQTHKNANGKTACCVDPAQATIELADKRFKVRAVYDVDTKTFTLTNYDLNGNVTEVKHYSTME